MRSMELEQKPYVKSHHNAALQKLTGRSKGSIEFKHQNISAVLRKLGEPWIPGYKPMVNFQAALIAGVERYLDQNPIPTLYIPKPPISLSEDGALFIGHAPPCSIETTENNQALERLVRKFDPADRDSRNRELGRLGEERVFKSEQARLRAEGRADLARKVEWTSQERGDGAGYDILSFEKNGTERFLEVKTTIGHIETPFYITRNEKLFSEERPDCFKLFRVYDFSREPKAFIIDPPLDHKLILTATNFRASFD